MPQNSLWSLKYVLRIAEVLSVTALFAYLLWKSWLRWGDPLIDFPRDLYTAWRMNEGEVLYRDMLSYYGPLSNLSESLGFKILGTGLETIVWMNIALTTAVLLLLRAIFGIIGNRFSVWLISVVFLSVFAFGNYVVLGNYNFITPYASQTTYSFLGLLLTLWGLLRHLQSGKPTWLAVAGFGLAVAYLDKPEATLAALGALGIYFAAQTLRAGRADGTAWRWLGRALVWLAGGFLLLWIPVFAYFWARANLALAWHAANSVPYSVLGGPLRSSAANSQLLQVVAGFDDLGRSLSATAYATGILVLVGGILGLATRQWSRAVKYSFAWWACLIVASTPALFFLCRTPPIGFWERSPSACVIPVGLAALVYSAWSLREAFRDGEDFPRALGLAVVGVAAFLALARIILNARISAYGFYLTPLAVFLCIHFMVVEAARASKSGVGVNWLLPAVFSPIVVTGCWVMLGGSLYYYGQKTLEVGVGRDRFYALPPSIQPNGWQLQTMLEAYHEMKPQPRTLAVLPEGIAVNYHLRIKGPLVELECTPFTLNYTSSERVLEELKANPPAAIFFHSRELLEYGAPYFGANEASGRAITQWIKDHYYSAGYAGESPYSITGHALDILRLKTEANPPAPAPQ